jgi:hypothetical protein
MPFGEVICHDFFRKDRSTERRAGVRPFKKRKFWRGHAIIEGGAHDRYGAARKNIQSWIWIRGVEDAVERGVPIRGGSSNGCTVRANLSDRRIRADREIASLRILQRRGSSMAFTQFFDAVYCLSLQEQPHRTATMADLFHRLGLCATVTFLHPCRAKHQPRAIWKSHRDMARHAIDRGFRKVLIFEDDADIRIGRDRLLARLHEAMARLPDDWLGLFLGHIPLQAYPIGFHLLRARSGAAHAYIASESCCFG